MTASRNRNARARLLPLSLLCLLWACAACEQLLYEHPPKPSTLEADIAFNDAGDTVTIENKNRTAWHKLYVTFIDEHQRRYYFVDEKLTLRPKQAIDIPLRLFEDAEGNALRGTKDDLWRWRIEDGTRIWRLQKATDFPTTP